MPSCDVLIIGGGAVGLALAASMKGGGREVVLVDARTPDVVGRDARVLALSRGSYDRLVKMEVCGKFPATPMTQVHVSQQGGWGRVLLKAEEYQQPALGYVASAGRLALVLREQAQAAGVLFLDQTKATLVNASADRMHVQLCGQHTESWGARLVVCAEGSIEAASDSAGIVERDYQQHALISEVLGEGAPIGRAFERFTPQGPLALLPWTHGSFSPTPAQQVYAIVHAGSVKDVDTWMQYDDAAYLADLQSRMGHRLQLHAVTPRLRFPLGLRYRRAVSQSRVVYVGNAAQTLHPVAGQGFNLALRDVSALSDILLKEKGDPGAERVLKAYAQARQLDRHFVMGFTDALVRGFSQDNRFLS